MNRKVFIFILQLIVFSALCFFLVYLPIQTKKHDTERLDFSRDALVHKLETYLKFRPLDKLDHKYQQQEIVLSLAQQNSIRLTLAEYYFYNKQPKAAERLMSKVLPQSNKRQLQRVYIARMLFALQSGNSELVLKALNKTPEAETLRNSLCIRTARVYSAAGDITNWRNIYNNQFCTKAHSDILLDAVKNLYSQQNYQTAWEILKTYGKDLTLGAIRYSWSYTSGCIAEELVKNSAVAEYMFKEKEHILDSAERNDAQLFYLASIFVQLGRADTAFDIAQQIDNPELKVGALLSSLSFFALENDSKKSLEVAALINSTESGLTISSIKTGNKEVQFLQEVKQPLRFEIAKLLGPDSVRFSNLYKIYNSSSNDKSSPNIDGCHTGIKDCALEEMLKTAQNAKYDNNKSRWLDLSFLAKLEEGKLKEADELFEQIKDTKANNLSLAASIAKEPECLEYFSRFNIDVPKNIDVCDKNFDNKCEILAMCYASSGLYTKTMEGSLIHGEARDKYLSVIVSELRQKKQYPEMLAAAARIEDLQHRYSLFTLPFIFNLVTPAGNQEFIELIDLLEKTPPYNTDNGFWMTMADFIYRFRQHSALVESILDKHPEIKQTLFYRAKYHTPLCPVFAGSFPLETPKRSESYNENKVYKNCITGLVAEEKYKEAMDLANILLIHEDPTEPVLYKLYKQISTDISGIPKRTEARLYEMILLYKYIYTDPLYKNGINTPVCQK